jgi:fluoride ion exporter CrcB/FEX
MLNVNYLACLAVGLLLMWEEEEEDESTELAVNSGFAVGNVA